MNTDLTLAGSGAALVGIDSLDIGDTEGGVRPAHATLLDAEDGG